MLAGSIPPGVPTSPRSDGGRLPILVVDDSEDFRGAITDLLSEEGLAHVACEDGRSVSEQVRRLGPCVILLDLLMPGLSGFEVLRHLSEEPTLPAHEIVVVTALSLRGLELARGVPVLPKPFDVCDLLDLLAKTDAKLRSRLSTSGAAP